MRQIVFALQIDFFLWYHHGALALRIPIKNILLLDRLNRYMALSFIFDNQINVQILNSFGGSINQNNFCLFLLIYLKWKSTDVKSGVHHTSHLGILNLLFWFLDLFVLKLQWLKNDSMRFSNIAFDLIVQG